MFLVLFLLIYQSHLNVSHDLIKTKIHAYGLSFPVLKLMEDCLQNCKQRTKVGTTYNNWQDILAGVPQGSILGTILFNIFFSELFLDQWNNYFTYYADDTTTYIFGDNTTDVLSSLTKISKMKANHDKCHLL